MAHTVQYLNV